MTKEALGSFEVELNKEKAQVLGSAGLDLEDCLKRLKALATEMEQTCQELNKSKKEKEQLAKAFHLGQLLNIFNGTRHKAIGARLKLIIHREAMGILRHNLVFENYPIPKPLFCEDLMPKLPDVRSR